MRIKVQQDYAQVRRETYPSIQDQLDFIYHNGLEAWMDMITQIKEMIPKDEETTN